MKFYIITYSHVFVWISHSILIHYFPFSVEDEICFDRLTITCAHCKFRGGSSVLS